MGLNKFPLWSEKYLGEIIASITYSLKYRNLGVNTAKIFTTTPLEEEGSYFWSADRLVNLDFFQQFQEAESEFGKSNSALIFEEKLGIAAEEIKEKREAAWAESKKPAPKPVRPVAAAKPAAAPKKETIVVDKPVTKEEVEKLGKELDKLNEQTQQSTENAANNK